MYLYLQWCILEYEVIVTYVPGHLCTMQLQIVISTVLRHW